MRRIGVMHSVIISNRSAQSPGRVGDVVDRIGREAALERVEDERCGGDERRGEGHSLEEDDRLQ